MLCLEHTPVRIEPVFVIKQRYINVTIERTSLPATYRLSKD